MYKALDKGRRPDRHWRVVPCSRRPAANLRRRGEVGSTAVLMRCYSAGMNVSSSSQVVSSLLPLVLVAALGCAADAGGEGEEGSTGTAASSTSAAASSGPGATTDAATGTTATTATTSTSGSTEAESESSSGSTGEDNSSLVNARPYAIVVPENYDPDVATPVVVLLHGYSLSGGVQAAYFSFPPDAEEHGYILVLPNGTLDASSNRFWKWDLEDLCCGRDPVDDVAYLGAVLDDVEAEYNVDTKRVYFVGHSAGGLMSYRLACDIGDRIAAIVSLAGAAPGDPSACAPETPVNILQVHGTNDKNVPFGGGGSHASANDTVAQWAMHNGCTGELAGDTSIDIEPTLKGDETLQQSYGGCPEGGEVGLWTIQEGSHVPTFDEAWADTVWAYLETHPKP